MEGTLTVSCRESSSTSRIYRVRDEHPRLVEHIDVDHDRDAWNKLVEVVSEARGGTRAVERPADHGDGDGQVGLSLLLQDRGPAP